jgi:hypothetical protein
MLFNERKHQMPDTTGTTTQPGAAIPPAEQAERHPAGQGTVGPVSNGAVGMSGRGRLGRRVIHCADDRPSRHLATAGMIGRHIQGRGAQTRKTRLEGRAIASISYEYLSSE